jgi:hypothetical protein
LKQSRAGHARLFSLRNRGTQNGQALWGVLTANRSSGYAETPEKATLVSFAGLFHCGGGWYGMTPATIALKHLM